MRKFGLIGFPLEQSFSNKFFTAKFEAENLKDCKHFVYSIRSIDEFEKVISDPELVGLNVTIPYKKSVIPYLHELNDVVQKIQACNCIKIRDGKLKGYNTDVIGFEKSLLPLLQTHHNKALILGTGGSASAVEYVLEKLGIDFKFVSRTKDKDSGFISYEDLDANILQSHHLIINCTPLGMYPKVDDFPNIPYHYLTNKHLLYDLIYNPEKTTFLTKGLEHRAAVKNGFEMLILQAEESWKIWNE
jgi:shikimate dehydrogenase